MTTPLFQILQRVTHDSYESIARRILECYEDKNSAIVHFVYYANSHLINKNIDYQKSLENADFLLPDGIAFQLLFARKILMRDKSLWYFLKNIKQTLPKIPSTNGTDFVPFFLDFLIKKNKNFDISIYGSSQEVNEKMKEYIEETYEINPLRAQNGFEEWKQFDKKNDKKIHILLVGRGTPLQETWIEENRENLEKNKYLVISVGGLFEFLTDTEKRAPKWVQKIR